MRLEVEAEKEKTKKK